MTALAIHQLTSRHPGRDGRPVTILEDLSLEVPAGALLVLVGASGCGKSTLLNHIAGFAAPAAGAVTVDGRTVTGPGAERGIIFQQDALLPWLTVQQNVAFGLQLQGLSAARRSTVALEMLSLVDLEGYADHPVWELSGGMKQRAALARALATDPKVLLMDEPFAALDAMTREQMQKLVLRIWRATGKQIVLVTHDIEEAVFLASDLVLLEGRPARVAAHRRLDFGRRHAEGETARAIKSAPEFIATREEVLAWLFRQEGET